MSGGELSKVADSRIKLWEVDGKTYTLSTLRVRQWGALEEWARNQPVEEAKKIANGLTDKDLARSIIQEARTQAKDISVLAPDFLQRMQSLEGIQYMFWLSLIRNHPQITLKEAGDLLPMEKSFSFLDDFMYLNESIVQQATPQGNGSRVEGNPTQ